ncbi:MAG: GNAT family N-acetyltransferase [Duncaniella sp.]|nr:GNAT family N-acetyltransferase [Duncaniella sp.]
MIELKSENSASVPAGMETVYTGAFPPEERRPWSDLLRRADSDPRFSLYTIMSDGIPAGLITVWNLGIARYVEHFAIDPAMRGAGIGQDVIKKIISMPGAPVVLEVESESTGDTARRRIGFYTRAGLTAHHLFSYIQPPYAPGLPEVPLTLMTSSPLPLDDITALLHREIYGKIQDDKS